MRSLLPFVTALGMASSALVPAAEPPKASIEKIAACTTPEGLAGVELILHDVPASQVRDRIAAAAGIRLVHAERIGSTRVTVQGLGCLPLRAALGLLASADDTHMAAVVPDAKGNYALIDMPHHAQIEALRLQAADLIGKDDAKRRALLEKILPLAVPPTPSDAEEPIGDVYADLIDLANERKDYAQAETLSRARIAQLERLSGTDDAEYGSALAELAYAHAHLGRDGAVDELERALAVLVKHTGYRSSPDAARATATLAQRAAAAKAFERAETYSRQAGEILAHADADAWDAMALFQARLADREAEQAIANAELEADRDGVAPHFERMLLRGQELKWPDSLLAFPREMIALQSDDPQVLEPVAAFYASVPATSADASPDDVTALWGLALIRAKQRRWDDAIAAWQRVRGLRAMACGAGDERTLRAGRLDLELLYALGNKLPPAQAESAPAATGTGCGHGRIGRVLTRDLAPFLSVHFQRQRRASGDEAARAAAQKGAQLSDATVLKQVSSAR